MPEPMTAPAEAAPVSPVESIQMVGTSAVLPEPAPDPAPASTPDSDTPVTEGAPDSPETPEPADAAEAVEAETAAEGSVTLTPEEAAGISQLLEMVESWRKDGGEPAPIAPPENAQEIATQAEAAQAQAPIPDWQPLTPEEADAFGILDPEAYSQRERTLGAAVLKEFGTLVMPEIRKLINEAADTSEVATLTHFTLRDRPDFKEVIPQLRNEIKKARAANPNADPDTIQQAAIKGLEPHVAALGALKRVRGFVDQRGSKPAAPAPGTARPAAQAPAKAPTIQERIQQQYARLNGVA